MGIQFSNPISAAAVQVAGPLVAAVTVRLATGMRFDPGFGVALALTLTGGAILAAGSLFGSGALTLGGGEIIVLLSNALWTVYSLKAQAWFDRASQLHRAYVASLSAFGWMAILSVGLVGLGWAHSPFAVTDGWVWTQLLLVAVFASGMGAYLWNVGASRLGVAIASLWVNLVPFFAVLWSMTYGFMPNAYQIIGGLVALSGVVYMQWRKAPDIETLGQALPCPTCPFPISRYRTADGSPFPEGATSAASSTSWNSTINSVSR